MATRSDSARHARQQTDVGDYLIRRLQQAGVGHVFGIPGDYVLGFYNKLVDSDLELIGTCTEIGAGFAADAYARVNGIGVACVTYCVGGFNALNAVAGAYAEKSPLVLISGAPGVGERAHSPLLHHQVRGFHTQQEVFEKVTVAAVALDDPASAPDLIDRALWQCLRHKRPVYIEIPRDIVLQRCAAPQPLETRPQTSDPATLEEALSEASGMIRRARRPVVLAGVEIHRFGLQEALLSLVETSQLPFATTLLGKSVIGERHPGYLGVYEGAMGLEKVRHAVESADCVLILGAFMTDINLGVYTAQLDPARTINATSERVSISRHHFDDIELPEFIAGLTARLGKRQRPKPAADDAQQRVFRPQPSRRLTVNRFFARMNEFLDQHNVVICDIGDSLFGAADLKIHRRTEFLSPAYYTSMGFAVPAAIGAQVNRRSHRPVVFVGDGAFQMTGHELSTVAKLGLNPIVFVLNNEGYTTERFISEGPYNDIHDWAYHEWPRIVRSGWGCEVTTEGELEEALPRAEAHQSGFAIINVHLDKLDKSRALDRLAKRLARRSGETWPKASEGTAR